MPLRKAVFWLHLTTGCFAGIVVFVMSVTGVLLAYQRQIVAWADQGSYRVAQGRGDAERLPLEEILAKLDEPPSAVTVRAGVGAPLEAAYGRERTLFIDSYSGEILGEGSRTIRGFFELVERWHRTLGADGENRAAGRAITGACNLAFLILVVSGPYLWWPRQWSARHWRAVGFPRRGLTGRARHFNWHNAIGIWCAIPLFFIVLSGVIMSYPWANALLYRLTGNQPPAEGSLGRQRGERRNPHQGRRHANWDGLGELETRAEEQVPDWRSITLRFQGRPAAQVTFTIDQGNGGEPEKRSQLTLDRRTGEVVRWEPFSSYNAGRRLRMWARFIHTGEAGGTLGQTLAAVVSAGAAVLAYTGLLLAWRRWRSWRIRKHAREEVAVGAD
jgi:uncharacterized iron-regulated membrane protein